LWYAKHATPTALHTLFYTVHTILARVLAAAAGADGRGAGGKSRGAQASPPGLSMTSLRPLMADMEQAGMQPALERGIAILRLRVVLPAMPAWLTELDFVRAFAVANPWDVGALVQSLRAAERQLRLRSAARAASVGAKWEVVDPPAEVPALPAWAADDQGAQTRMVVALGRLALGAAIEAAIVEETLDRVAPGARTNDGDTTTGRLYQDSFLAALWSSAHAQYIAYIQSGVEEPPLPGISTVPSAASEFDLSDLFARRFCQRLCPKTANSLLSVLMRSTYVPPVTRRPTTTPLATDALLSSSSLAGTRVLAAGTRCWTAR